MRRSSGVWARAERPSIAFRSATLTITNTTKDTLPYGGHYPMISKTEDLNGSTAASQAPSTTHGLLCLCYTKSAFLLGNRPEIEPPAKPYKQMQRLEGPHDCFRSSQTDCCTVPDISMAYSDLTFCVSRLFNRYLGIPHERLTYFILIQMADPLSVIASNVGAAVSSVQLKNKVHDFSDKYRNTPTQMTILRRRCRTSRASLTSLQPS